MQRGFLGGQNSPLCLGVLRLLSHEAAAPSRGLQPSCTQKKQKSPSTEFVPGQNHSYIDVCIQIPGLLQNVHKGIASHSHQEKAAEFIWGGVGRHSRLHSGGKIYLHNFPLESHWLSNNWVPAMPQALCQALGAQTRIYQGLSLSTPNLHMHTSPYGETFCLTRLNGF